LTFILVFEGIKLELFIDSIAHIFSNLRNFTLAFTTFFFTLALIYLCRWHIWRKTIDTLSVFNSAYPAMICSQFYEVLVFFGNLLYLASWYFWLDVCLRTNWWFLLYWSHFYFAVLVHQTLFHLFNVKIIFIMIFGQIFLV
jgi:hypothetical protein